MAIAGISRYAAARAQATVPEEKATTPAFSPLLIPETTTSGSCGRREGRAILTQVAGVAAIANHRIPSVSQDSTAIGLPKVIPCPTRLLLAAGAATVTSPSDLSLSTRALIPGAWNPSSLEIRMRYGCWAGGGSKGGVVTAKK